MSAEEEDFGKVKDVIRAVFSDGEAVKFYDFLYQESLKLEFPGKLKAVGKFYNLKNGCRNVRINNCPTKMICQVVYMIIHSKQPDSPSGALNYFLENARDIRKLVLGEKVYEKPTAVEPPAPKIPNPDQDSSSPAKSLKHWRFRKQFIDSFDPEELKVLVYIAAYHSIAEKIFGAAERKYCADLVNMAENKSLVVLGERFPLHRVVEVFVEAAGVCVEPFDGDRIISAIRDALPKLRDEAVANVNAKKRVVAPAAEPYRYSTRWQSLRAAQEESVRQKREIYTQFFREILDYASKTLTIDNQQVGDVAVSKHAWQRFVERYLRVNGPPDFTAGFPDFGDYAKTLRSTFRRARIVPMSPKEMAYRTRRHGESSIYLNDEYTRLTFVVSDEENKILKTVYVQKLNKTK